MFIPINTMIINQRKLRTRAHAFQPSCDDKVDFWNPGEIMTSSFLAPRVGSTQALATLNKLGCWLAKQTNATASALCALLTDVDSTRHATLQNRAAIDFLLLAHRHGCEILEGMCCIEV